MTHGLRFISLSEAKNQKLKLNEYKIPDEYNQLSPRQMAGGGLVVNLFNRAYKTADYSLYLYIYLTSSV
jgi:hypothetical protein